MARISRTVLPDYTCGECAHAVPDGRFLSIRERRPLLGRCPHAAHMVLLSESRRCEWFKRKENGNY